MKRVERRGTADASMLAQNLSMAHPAPQSSFSSQTQTQTQPSSTQPTQISQTQLGTQYSPQRWQNGRNYENGNGEKRYDVLPRDYGKRDGSVEGKGSAVKEKESEKDAEGETA
jgi:hypothetical protein